jgi:hypothetical protein
VLVRWLGVSRLIPGNESEREQYAWKKFQISTWMKKIDWGAEVRMSKLWAGCLVCLGMSALFGMFPRPIDTPVDRLIRNAEADIQAHPKDANAHCTLARLHYLAFSLRTDTLSSGRWNGTGKPGSQPKGNISDEQALQHLTAAVVEIGTALKLDPTLALSHLTAACIREEGAPFAPRVKSGDTANGWMDLAIAEYKRAHDLAWAQDSKLEKAPFWGVPSLVSHEAAESYIRLVTSRGLRPGEKEIVDVMEAHVKKLSSLPPNRLMTPIVISMTPHASLSELLDPTIQIGFDLDGTGRDQKWPWLQPDTGLLVWDPKRTGVITSGRQLFGTVSWWIFWENGYAALTALDDNHDGWLTGRELDGLALWFDRNQNGRSDPGEVIPIAELGIDAIHVKADGREGVAWKSSKGIRLRDGSFLPTWDWVAQPVPCKPAVEVSRRLN